MADELPRFVRVARAVALLSTAASCDGAATTTPPVTPVTARGTETKTSGAEPSEIVQGDPTTGSGPCRCSWDTNTAAAARVCKKNELAYTGSVCAPAGRPKFHGKVIPGPLPPPDLATS